MILAIGLLGFLPQEICGNTRRIETDDGEGTVLQIIRTDRTITLQIIQYNSNKEVLSEGSQWHIKTTDLDIFLMPYSTEGYWGMIGEGGVVLHIEKTAAGAIIFRIYDPAKEERITSVVQFSQLIAGGRLKHVLYEITMLTDALQHVVGSSMVTPYMIIEGIYDAISLEKGFTVS